MKTFKIENYKSALSLFQTQLAIDKVKRLVQDYLIEDLNVRRVSAPLFVDPNSGLNDNLNGVERPVSFDIKNIGGINAEVVHSLAKWKRYALKLYGFEPHTGLYTDMNAIRRDEELDNIHSLYVDQWDWEKIILREDRNINYLEDTVKTIYSSIRKVELEIQKLYPCLQAILPEDIFFIDSQKLLEMYPDKSLKEREYLITKEKKAVFIERIGGKLSDGVEHDLRSPDYDDWNLNGDILVYYPLLDIAFELSSMGIRVDSESLLRQLEISDKKERMNLPFHRAILNDELPLTIGGGIGQSRLCMFLLKKAHIGEIQCSIWPKEMKEACEKENIFLL